MMSIKHRTWVEVDTRAIESNFQALKIKVKAGVTFMAVLKGDAWGLGLLDCAKLLVNKGADWIGVTTIEDLRVVNKHLPNTPIMLLCEPNEQDFELVVLAGARMALSSVDTARKLSSIASRLNRRVPVHIKINTGLNRIGVSPVDALAFVREVAVLPGMQVEGIFTHFSCADHLEDQHSTKHQLTKLFELVKYLADQKVAFPMVHAANSAGLLAYPESHLDMVRVGMALAGLYPGPGFDEFITLKNPLNWKSRVIQTHQLKKGDTVGYGGHFTCSVDTSVATLSVGFADGLTKRFLNGGRVLIDGRYCPIIAICMDMCMVETGSCRVESLCEKEAVILGRQGDRTLDPQTVASVIGADVEELMCGISSRVPRNYDFQ